MGCALVWLEPREGEKLGVSLGMLVAKIERLKGGRFRLTRVSRVGGKPEHKIEIVHSLRAVHAFKQEIAERFGA